MAEHSYLEQFRWTEGSEQTFLETLANKGSVLAACRKVGCARSTAYKHRDEDEAFAAQWVAATKVAVARFEHYAIKRGTVGDKETEITEKHDGNGLLVERTIKTKRVVSNSLLIRVLEAHDERYRKTSDGSPAPVTVNILNVVTDANENARKRAAELRARSVSAPAIEHINSGD